MLSEEAGPLESVGTGRQQEPQDQSEASECGFIDLRVCVCVCACGGAQQKSLHPRGGQRFIGVSRCREGGF